MYQCDICHRRYKTLTDKLTCEEIHEDLLELKRKQVQDALHELEWGATYDTLQLLAALGAIKTGRIIDQD